MPQKPWLLIFTPCMAELQGGASTSPRAPGTQYQTVLLPAETAMHALARETLLPEVTLSEAATKGAVWVSLKRGKGQTRPQRLRSLTEIVSEGSQIMLNYDTRVLAAIPQAMQRIADHVNYSVWFKPSGMLCQGSKWSDHTVATTVAQSLCEKPCFLVHRLDRAACGLMLIAHTRNALRALTKMFEQRDIEKTYFARVVGHFAAVTPLHIDEKLDGKSASTRVNQADYDAALDVSALKLNIATGRKHQIRRHLLQLGHPLVGDRFYGQSTSDEDLQLVACELSLVCPFTGEKIHLSIDAERALQGDVVI